MLAVSLCIYKLKYSVILNWVFLTWHERFLQLTSCNNDIFCFLHEWLYLLVGFIYYSLFIDKSRINSKIEEHLELLSEDRLLKVYAYEDIQEELRKLGQMEKKIWVSCGRCVIPAGIYLLKVNHRNTRTRREISSKLTIKTPEWRLYC